mmetsp:Transcript_52899/g.105110  ORF Transcript_52899/g.105110 Transcript_52899/m.105110 type:complete len:110 (+) Transcript_52899:43-372(+)
MLVNKTRHETGADSSLGLVTTSSLCTVCGCSIAESRLLYGWRWPAMARTNCAENFNAHGPRFCRRLASTVTCAMQEVPHSPGNSDATSGPRTPAVELLVRMLSAVLSRF